MLSTMIPLTLIILTLVGLQLCAIQVGFHGFFGYFPINTSSIVKEFIDDASANFDYRFSSVLLMSAFSWYWAHADWFYRANEPMPE